MSLPTRISTAPDDAQLRDALSVVARRLIALANGPLITTHDQKRALYQASRFCNRALRERVAVDNMGGR